MNLFKSYKHLLKGFTLVELIVVISVLAVLATIAMSQISNITAGARDSQRMTDMSSMKSSLELYKAKTGKLPIPTNGSGVTYSGGLLWTQGTFGESVVREIKSITPKPVDPISKIEYAYSIANNNREFEIGGILEKATGFLPSVLNEVFAASQNITYIEGTYNGISLKVHTGSKVYVVAAPSIVASVLGTTLETTLLSIEGLGSLPQGFSGVVTSTAQTGTFTPTIAWSGATLPETSTGAEALIQGLQNAYTGSFATNLSQISALVSATGTQITSLGAGLVENSLGGKITGEISSSGGGGGGSTLDITAPASCPSGFIPVPGNETFNQSGFCVMKYEAKAQGGSLGSQGGHSYNAADAIVSNATDYLISDVTQQQAINACQSIGAHLITNNEWMTIARNIERVASNWSSGIVGNGYIYSGHNDASPYNFLVASTDDNQGYINTGNSGDNQRRTLTLSNGNVIWDLAGNALEHVNKANTIDGVGYWTNQTAFTCGTPTSWSEWTTCSSGDRTAQSASNASYNSTQGIGQINYSQGVTANIFLRGGALYDGPHAGVFALDLMRRAGLEYCGDAGFRCAR